MTGNKKVFNVVELFSGIGSQAKALKNIGVDFNILNTCEWNLHALMAYAEIHDIKADDYEVNLPKGDIADSLFGLGISNDGKSPATQKSLMAYSEEALKKIYATVKSTRNLVDISKVRGDELASDIDILTYSFPCQDLSNVGAFHGYTKGIDRNAGNRSGLLWEVERILLERKEEEMFMPHFLLMENVPALNSQRHKKNFREWQNQLEDMGYHNEIFLLNAKDYGLPQNRERLLMLSVLTDGDKDIEDAVERFFNENKVKPDWYFTERKKKEGSLSDFLKTDYSIEKYRNEALECQPNKTKSRIKIWEENVQLTDNCGNIKPITTSTLTTKQDRHPNSGNIWVGFDNGKADFRYLTPRECFLLMGFDENDYDKVVDGNFEIKKNSMMFTRDNLIKMAGNSIAVNVLEAVFMKVVELDNILF